MKIITPNILYERLIAKYEVKKIEDEEIRKIAEENLLVFVNGLYEISTSVVKPLSKNETFLFRKKYGIFDKGVYQPLYNVEGSPVHNSDIKITMKIANTEIKKYIKIKKIEIEQLSVFDVYTDKIYLADKQLGELDLCSQTDFEKLRKKGIFTLKDLLQYDRKTIEVIILSKTPFIKNIYNLGLKFISEITPEEKEQAIKRNSIDKILNSDISWLGLSREIEYYLKKTQCINKIRDIGRSSYIDKEATNRLKKLELSFLLNSSNKKEYNITDEFLNLDISKLNICVSAYNCLKRSGINTIRDLISKDTKDLLMIRNLSSNSYSDIIQKVHRLGLYFNDEREVIKLESEVENHKTENATLEDVISKKEKLVKKANTLLQEKEQLSKRNEELDLEINEVIKKLQNVQKGETNGKSKK
ncbi:MAG: hypothetical protein IJY25_00885 [Bacilli bacterium]|nr:hypothetical protein [Bacilli bacterium]